MNSRELSRFHDLLSRWPPKRPKAAIYLLVQRNKIRLKWALRCIYTLDMFFNKKYKYPIIFFHEDLQKTQIERLRKLSSSYLYFQQVIFEIPPFINQSQVHNITICSGHPIGYRHMCRFYSKLVFEQPIMSRLEYYWRLDDDSYITRSITYDVFQFMAKKDILYGYNNKKPTKKIAFTNYGNTQSNILRKKISRPPSSRIELKERYSLVTLSYLPFHCGPRLFIRSIIII